MSESQEAKERIIEATTSLIAQSEGDVSRISTRAIAEKACVGVGLINYHFHTKDNLIEISVERMIGEVIGSFAPETTRLPPTERLRHSAKLVMDFLMANPAAARISILSDSKAPRPDDNTMKSATSANATLGVLDPSNKDQFILSFALTAVMQALFLRKDQSEESFGFDLSTKEQRDMVLDLLIDSIFAGTHTSGQGKSHA